MNESVWKNTLDGRKIILHITLYNIIYLISFILKC